jgi:Tfp pilus assembly protein PilF
MGFASYLKGETAQSIRYLEIAKGIIKPSENWNTQLYSIMGDVYHSLNRHRESDAAFEQVLMLNPDDEHVLNNYSYYLSLRKEQLEKAARMARRLVEALPKESTYLDTYAWVLYQQGNYQEALRYLAMAIQEGKSPSSAIWEHYGDALYRLGRVDEAVKSWKKANDLPNADQNLEKKIKMKRIVEN